MTSNEITLLMEQSRQTHAMVKATYDLLQSHIEDDRIVAATVTRHSTYWGVTKWIFLTVSGFVASWLGLGSHWRG